MNRDYTCLSLQKSIKINKKLHKCENQGSNRGYWPIKSYVMSLQQVILLDKYIVLSIISITRTKLVLACLDMRVYKFIAIG